MKLVVLMPDVRDCAVEDCAYNAARRCHARAITVGDGLHPGCDTFSPANERPHVARHTAGVGACRVAGCRHNRELECHAGSIRVARHDGHADCVTFEPKLADAG